MIGIFDSGAGGLTVLRALRDSAPEIDIVYFGDTKHAPYGTRTHIDIRQLCKKAVSTLHDGGANVVVAACNSVAAALHLDWLDLNQVQFVGIVGSTVAALEDESGNILVCATQATVDSGVYQEVFRLHGKAVTVVAVPQLAALIESGAGSEAECAEIRNSLESVDINDFSHVILGCTHFPLVKERFVEAMGKRIEDKLFDPAAALAQRILQEYPQYSSGSDITKIVLSAPSQTFVSHAKNLFPEANIEIMIGKDSLFV